MIWDVNPGSLFQSGSRGQKDTGSRMRNTDEMSTEKTASRYPKSKPELSEKAVFKKVLKSEKAVYFSVLAL